jgi:polysaccharide export outer membrane protein
MSGGRILVLASLVALHAACASAPRSPTAPAVPDESDATLGPGDVFEVEVFGEKELSGKHRVGEDGKIGFPLVGEVEVAGKTPSQVAETLERALRDQKILREPYVNVFITEHVSKRIMVMGAVSKPGAQGIIPGMTIMQAISMAGGLTPIAAGDSTIVTRRVDGELKRFTVPMESIIEGRADDFPLQSGDIVFVPERVF